jgi:superfamily II DNA or RNA helicase
MSNTEINPYKLINISDVNLHIGNGAKNELKNKSKLYNFKFFYKVSTQYKQCSAGFDSINDFIKFIKPINSHYYIYEYIFENRNVCPYFDYEFELDSKPSEQEIIKYLTNIKTNIINVFKQMFNNIELKPTQIKILNSHGLKSNSKFKVSWHIVIKGYYFSSNFQCAYVCEKLKELDDSFDSSVYSRDRLMRTYGSAKNWDDLRIMREENESHIDITKLSNYLITHIEPDSIKLKCLREIKKEIEKKKYTRKFIDKNIKPDEIGSQIEQILKSEYHEDTYFTKSIMKYDNIQFYGFNYTNRYQKCFSGNKHDQIGFYCWVDSCANIILKCFSANCQGCRKIIGNLNKSDGESKALTIESDYLNKSAKVNELLKQFKKVLLIRSQMGTGKTELICDYMNEIKPKRVLWISTRQTYSHNINERLNKFGFVNYLDDKENFIYKPKIIVQLESLTQLDKMFKIIPYDLIVLDEIESILYHFDSSTIAHKSSQTFDLLFMLCKSTKSKVICMDADLGLRTIEFAKDLDPDYKLVINKYKKSDIIINMVDNKDWFIEEIKKNLITNKLNCCIIGLSTKLLYQLEELLKEWKINYLIHTRESDDKFKKELAKVNELWVKYQIVLFSPTISVGVDFTKIHFDKIYGIITPNTASPRTFKQMLGRLRTLKNPEIICYYQNITICTDAILYNYNEMIGYFKYADMETKTTKKYILKEDSSLEVQSGFGLYDRIMMHNKIENLNKLGNNFMTQFYLLCEDSNYKIQFIKKSQDKKKKIELNDDVYRDKIIASKDINDDEYKTINEKVLTNKALESEKFSIIKYEFKNFWDLEQVDKKNLEMYFRCEMTLNRLLYLLDKDIKNVDEHIDINTEKKTNIIKNMIKTLGFDLTNFDLKLPREEYYLNVKKLFSDTNQFKKDYANIRILFDKDKHELNDNLKGSSLVKLLNGFLNEFGIEIEHKHSTKKINEETKVVYFYKIKLGKKYNKYIK